MSSKCISAGYWWSLQLFRFYRFKECGVQGIYSGVQFIFVPLKLETLLSLVLNYRINVKYETFLSFASRVTWHLTLCERVHPISERKSFLEGHRWSIFKQNLPSNLLDEIERKEKLFTEYSSAEILEITVSYRLNSKEFRVW